jgi:hypothetical protein
MALKSYRQALRDKLVEMHAWQSYPACGKLSA